MLSEGLGVLVEHAGSPAVVPGLDGIELAPPIVGNAALDRRLGQSGELDNLGLGQPVGRQSQDFHPLLNLRTGMVEPVVVDAFEFVRRDLKRSHGILPRGGSGAEC